MPMISAEYTGAESGTDVIDPGATNTLLVHSIEFSAADEVDAAFFDGDSESATTRIAHIESQKGFIKYFGTPERPYYKMGPGNALVFTGNATSTAANVVVEYSVLPSRS